MNCELYVGQILYTAQAISPSAVFVQATVPPVFGLLHEVTLLHGVPEAVMVQQVWIVEAVHAGTSVAIPVATIVYYFCEFT